MKSSTLTVPIKTGAAGQAIEDYILERVATDDLEKHLGQVIESALAATSVPLACLVLIEEATLKRSAFFFKSSDLGAISSDESQENRKAALLTFLEEIFDLSEVGTYDVLTADLATTGKTKLFSVNGDQPYSVEPNATALISGVLEMFQPKQSAISISSLVAKVEDLGLSHPAIALFFDQMHPEVYIARGNEITLGTSNANITAIGPITAAVHGVFQQVSSEVNDKHGFEAGAAFA